VLAVRRGAGVGLLTVRGAGALAGARASTGVSRRAWGAGAGDGGEYAGVLGGVTWGGATWGGAMVGAGAMVGGGAITGGCDIRVEAAARGPVRPPLP